jgi:uncharacterized membrane protein
VLAAGILVTGRVPVITLSRPNLSRMEKIVLIFGLIMLICCETGIYLRNAEITISVLVFSILLIIGLLLICIRYQKYSLKRIYPVILFLISFSLLLIVSLRSNYIIGDDVNEEYYLFFSTLTNMVWVPDSTLLLNSALSISILPTIFENFLFVNPQILYKLLFPLLSIILPLIIYATVKKYFSDILALVAACFFIFQKFFVGIPLNPRTSVAIIFYALTVLVLCDRELANAKKYAMMLLFITGGIFSHYTSSFVFLFILLSAYLMDLILSRIGNGKEKGLVNIPLLVFFMSIIFFWYQQTINIVFNKGMEFTLLRKNIFENMMEQNLTTYHASPVYINPPTILDRVAVYSRLALYVLIGLGILVALYVWFRTRYQRESASGSPGKMSKFLISMGCAATAILFVSVVAPSLFFQYDTGRITALLFVILPVFLILGGLRVFDPTVWATFLPPKIKVFQPVKGFFISNRNEITAVILLFLLVPQLLFATYLTSQIDGSPYSVLLNPPKSVEGLDPAFKDPLKYSYIFDQDASALQWFRSYSYKYGRIYADPYGNKKITCIVTRRFNLYQNSFLDLYDRDLAEAYVFVTVLNNYFGHFRDFDGRETDVSTANWIFSEKSKIFSNGADIYR